MQLEKHNYFILGMLSVVLLVMLITTIWYVRTHDSKNSSYEAAKPALSTLDFTDLAGTPLSLSKFKGSYILINSWATWSPLSAKDLALLDAFAAKYPEIVVLAINRSESALQVEAYRNAKGQFENITFLLDPEDNFHKYLEGKTMPESALYGKKGELLYRYKKELSEEVLNNAILSKTRE